MIIATMISLGAIVTGLLFIFAGVSSTILIDAALLIIPFGITALFLIEQRRRYVKALATNSVDKENKAA